MRLFRRDFTRPDELPPRTKAILASVVAGHPYAEVARQLGITAGTVRECVHIVARDLPGPGIGRIRVMRWWLAHPPADPSILPP